MTWQLKKEIPGWCEVSTIELTRLPGAYETCVFWKDGTSEVQGRYMTKGEAVMMHVCFCAYQMSLAAQKSFRDQD